MTAGLLLVLAACASPASDSPPAAAPVTTTAVAPTDDTATAQSEPNPGSTVAPDEAPSATAPATEATEAPKTSGESEQAPATTPSGDVRAADGCSVDNSPTEPNVAEGPPPAIEVRAAAAGNPLPDLAVRRINCDGGWVNLKNELPGDVPLLVWFWAPH